MPTLTLIRHAEPVVTGVLLGQTDPPLSERGRTQAAHLAELEPFDTVISSPLLRATQTAGNVPAALRTQLHDLREISYGDWDGCTWAAISALDPNLSAAKLQDWFRITPPGGEPWSDFTHRVSNALHHIRNIPGSVALVGHIGVHSVIAQLLTGANPAQFQQAYCEVLRYEY